MSSNHYIQQEVMSIAEARQLMPDTTATMTDDEVGKLVTNLEILATAIVEAVQFDDRFRVNIEL